MSPLSIRESRLLYLSTFVNASAATSGSSSRWPRLPRICSEKKPANPLILRALRFRWEKEGEEEEEEEEWAQS
jgi:hypothetical protein